MTSYHYALNNPIMFNDPMGDLVGGGGLPVSGFRSHRIGQGSGNHWSDGMNMSDWNGWTGSQMYRDGLASGLIDFNGSLYHWGDQGFAKLNMTTNMTNGAYGFYADGGGSGGLQNWSGIQGITGVKSREYAGAGYQWHTVGQGNANQGGDNALNYFDKNNGDIGNGLAGVGYVSGAVGNWAGNIIKSRSLYGAPGATTILRTPLANIHVPTGALRTTGTVLRGLGTAVHKLVLELPVVNI